MDAPLPPGPSFFRFSAAEECARCLTEAGLAAIEVAEVPITWTLPSAAQAYATAEGRLQIPMSAVRATARKR
jgi:hypothetical protein